MRSAAPNVITPAAVTASHHLEPRLAAITGSTIMANGTNQKKGPILSNTGSSTFIDFGASIKSHMKAMQAIAIHPRALLRFRSNFIPSRG